MRVLILFLLISIYGHSQKIDKRLQQIIDENVKNFNGQIGIYVKNLRTGKVAMYNADTIFPTASVVKVPILIGVMDKIYRNELHYDSSIIYHDSLLYAGEDILGSFKSGEKIALKKVIMLMLTTSDNTASLWLQSLAGKGTRINTVLDSLGFTHTRVNSRTPGREPDRSVYGWGQTTPREIATLFEIIYNNKPYGPVLSDRMMRVLGRNYWDQNEAISQIPPYIQVFSKNGCVNASRNEILLVNAPGKPYVFAIFTKNNKDQQWISSNEAWTLTRKLSALLWDHFAPKDKWVAPNAHAVTSGAGTQ